VALALDPRTRPLPRSSFTEANRLALRPTVILRRSGADGGDETPIARAVPSQRRARDRARREALRGAPPRAQELEAAARVAAGLEQIKKTIDLLVIFYFSMYSRPLP
jgi:hypothetical protein